MSLFILAFTSLLAISGTSAFAGEGPKAPEAEEAVDPRVGAGKAVEAFSKEDGFKLSPKATAQMGVSFTEVAAGPWRLPKESIIRIKQSTGVYRKFEGWISFVLVKVVAQSKESVTVTSQDIEPGDEIATTGATFLRMTDADLNSGTVDSCAH